MSRKRSIGFAEGSNGDGSGGDEHEPKPNKGKRVSAETVTGESTTSDGGSSWMPPVAARISELSSQLGSRGPLPGIKNLGATCYINSLIQSLFMTPEFRAHILQWPFDAQQRHPMNLAFQLQLLFRRMSHPSRASVDAKDLVDSFGMGTAAYRQQHDVQELNRQLLDVVQTFIDKAGTAQVLKSLYEGQFYDFKRCKRCGLVTATPSPYQDLSVAIQGISTLMDALKAFATPDEIDGVTCDSCNDKVTVEKGLTYRTFPQILTIQLRRIDYNRVTYERERVTQDVSLPLELDVAELIERDVVGEDAMDQQGPAKYQLQTVIAHSGTAYFGHYYAFSRVDTTTTTPTSDAASMAESGEPANAATVGGKWIKFNDSSVDFATADAVEEYVDPASWKRRAVVQAEKRNAAKRAEAEAAKKAEAETAAGDGGDSPADAPAESEKVAAPAAAEATMGSPSGTDDFCANLFDDIGANNSNSNGGGTTFVAGDGTVREPAVSGSSYYAIYRRVDLPWPTERLEEADANLAVPDYVVEATAAEDEALSRDTAELASLRSVVAVGLVFRGKKHWVNSTPECTLAELCATARQVFAIDAAVHLRLRAFSSSLGALGATYPADCTLEDTGATAGSSYTLLGVEATTDAAVAESVWPTQKIDDWDRPLHIRVYQSATDSFAFLRDLVKADPAKAGVPDVDLHGRPTLPWQEFAVTNGTSALDVCRQAAHLAGFGADSIDDLEFCINHRGSVVPVRFNAETGEPRDLSQPFFDVVPYAPEAESLMIERRVAADAPPLEVPEVIAPLTNPRLLLRAHIALEMQNVVTVTVKNHGARHQADKAEDDDGEAEASAVETFTVQVDGRKHMIELKSIICDRLGTASADVQLLIDDERRERPSLVSTVRAVTFGMKKLNVGVVDGKPLKEDEAYVEVFVATNKVAPVVQYLGKVLASRDKSTVADIVAAGLAHPKAEALGLDPSDPALCRPRLMAPTRTNVLGNPMTKPRLVDNMTNHNFNSLRVVLQPLDERPAQPLTKASLILALHVWDSRNPDPKTSLGPRREFVTAKDAPVRDLIKKMCEILDVDSDGLPAAEKKTAAPAVSAAAAAATAPAAPATNGGDQEAPNPEEEAEKKSESAARPAPPVDVEFARTRLYLLTDHSSVATKLPWGLVDLTDPKDLARHLGGFPLSLEQDDLIVIRKPSDPWPEGIVQQYGDVVGTRIVVKRREKKKNAKGAGGKGEAADAPKEGDNPGPSGGKKRRDEPGLALRAVWEMPPEEEEEKAGDGNAIGNKPADSDDAATAAAGASDPVAPAATSASAGCGNIVDKMEKVAYSRDLHTGLDEACPVCTCDFEEGEEIVIIPSCTHVFHPECLAPWADDRGTCAKCLQVIILD